MSLGRALALRLEANVPAWKSPCCISGKPELLTMAAPIQEESRWVGFDLAPLWRKAPQELGFGGPGPLP